MSPGSIIPASRCNPPPTWFPPRSGPPILPRRSSSPARTPSPIPSPAHRSSTGWSSEQENQPMKTSLKAENRGWPRENAKNTGWPTGTKNDRITAGQNHNERHRSVLMILSCHHSVWPPRLQKKRKRDFEQEATERTEIRKAKPLCLGSMAICRPLTRVIYSFESALCSLLCLLFKPIWLRSSLCALCVLLWQSSLAGVHYVDANSTNATAPYTNWTTAATTIQDAVDAAAAGDEVVVTNGTYRGGVGVGKQLTVRSVNGPQ